MNDASIDQSNVYDSFPLDHHDVDPWVLCAESKGEMKVLNSLVLEGDVLVEASLEHHRTVVDVLHSALLCQVEQLPETDSTFSQNCIDRLLIVLVRMEDQTCCDLGIVNLEHFLYVLCQSVLM